MAKGDVVNGISALTSSYNFQPASGVEIVISSYSSYNSWLYLSDGTKRALTYIATNATPYTGTSINMKMCINNTNWFSCDSSNGQYSSFTGIQTK